MSESLGNEPAGIGVVVVDDHSMFPDEPARIIATEAGLSFLGTAGTVSDALDLVGRTSPEIVLMDYRFADGDGALATQQILEKWPETKIIMLFGVAENDLLAGGIEAGCAGLIAKDRAAEDVVAAIRSAARGESVLRASELSDLLGRLRSAPDGAAVLLSNREHGVLRLVARARSTEEIATELYLSVHTVRNHLSYVLTKLGAHSRLEAVAIAARDGLISIGELG